MRTCEECNQENTSRKWCKACNAKHFQQNGVVEMLRLTNLFKILSYQQIII